jgi:hypothetical protein
MQETEQHDCNDLIFQKLDAIIGLQKPTQIPSAWTKQILALITLEFSGTIKRKKPNEWLSSSLAHQFFPSS